MRIPDAIKSVEIVSADGSKLPAELWVWYEDADTHDPWGEERLSLRFGNREITQSHENIWDALCAIRRELESEGMLLGCYGASRDCYPSGMSLSMGGGSQVYRLRLGQQARQADLVDLLDTGPDVLPATVKEQAQFYAQWVASLGKGNTDG